MATGVTRSGFSLLIGDRYFFTGRTEAQKPSSSSTSGVIIKVDTDGIPFVAVVDGVLGAAGDLDIGHLATNRRRRVTSLFPLQWAAWPLPTLDQPPQYGLTETPSCAN
jgi:hypothetical protein